MARREYWPDERIGAIELESHIADRIDRNEAADRPGARRESRRRVPQQKLGSSHRGPYRTTIGTVALVPGTYGLLAGGTTHAYANPGVNITAVLLQYRL